VLSLSSISSEQGPSTTFVGDVGNDPSKPEKAKKEIIYGAFDNCDWNSHESSHTEGGERLAMMGA